MVFISIVPPTYQRQSLGQSTSNLSDITNQALEIAPKPAAPLVQSSFANRYLMKAIRFADERLGGGCIHIAMIPPPTNDSPLLSTSLSHSVSSRKGAKAKMQTAIETMTKIVFIIASCRCQF
jgi:hypothetical protein